MIHNLVRGTATLRPSALLMLFVLLLITMIHYFVAAEENDKYKLPELCPALKNELFGYIIGEHQTPEDYIISKFKNHDIVFIGEFHRIKQNVELIHRLIPELYENSVHILGIECALYENQGKIDSLIFADSYDEFSAQRILFDQFVFWGYQEYADLFKTAWSLNNALPEDSIPFRVIGLNIRPDWRHVITAEDRENPEVMKKVWSCGDPDEYMAQTIIKEIIDKNEKALIFCGSHHAFTEYKQPLYDEKTKEFTGFVENRMGNLIYDIIGKRAFTIMLHAPWINAQGYSSPYVYPVDGIIDALLATLPAFYRNAAFDTKETPFGSLPARTTLYKYGYKHFSLNNYCDGYICQGLLSEYTGVTPIQGFINEDNLEAAKLQSPNPEFKKASTTIEDFNRAIQQDANISYRFRKYK